MDTQTPLVDQNLKILNKSNIVMLRSYYYDFVERKLIKIVRDLIL